MDLSKLFEEADQRSRHKSLVDILEEQSLIHTKRVHKAGNNLRASGFGGCLRANLYRARGYEESYDVGTFLTFEQGHKIHEVIQSLLKDAGVMLSMEEEIETIPGVPGHYDGDIKYLGKSLLEIKTVGYGQFERLFKYGQRQISKKYKIQSHLYMNKLGRDKVVFLFVNKNRQCSEEFAKEFPGANQQFLEIVVNFDKDFYEKEIIQRKAEYDKHIAEGTLPVRKDCSECSYCPFLAKCKEDHEAKKIEAKNLKKLEKESSAQNKSRGAKTPRKKKENTA